MSLPFAYLCSPYEMYILYYNNNNMTPVSCICQPLTLPRLSCSLPTPSAKSAQIEDGAKKSALRKNSSTTSSQDTPKKAAKKKSNEKLYNNVLNTVFGQVNHALTPPPFTPMSSLDR